MNTPKQWTPGTWWNAPETEIFRAYYLCLRACYGMPAQEALSHARSTFKAYPEFFRNPIDSLRKATGDRS